MKASAFSRHIQEALSEQLAIPLKITGAETAHGGSINECFILQTDQGRFFLKRNDAVDFPGMFTAESLGLQTLAKTDTLKTPQVILTGNFKSYSYMVLEYFEKTSSGNTFWESFGHTLAQLHRHNAEQYGFVQDNYIGSLLQQNKNKNNWSDFYIENRLEPMALLAVTNKKIPRSLYERIRRAYHQIQLAFPVELPTLLHGDLWSGNFMALSDGTALVFDPAVYYGHREMDLAMTRLFGGFHQRFYEAYHAAYPLQPEWEKRVELCQLYPLLVHVNLFGGGYANQIDLIVRKWE